MEKIHQCKYSAEEKRSTTKRRSTEEKLNIVTINEGEIPKKVIDLETTSHGSAGGNTRGKNNPKDGKTQS